MPGIFPTRIDQVTDQTQPAGKNLLDIMLEQSRNNPWEKVREIIDTNYSKAIKAEEQELLNNAVDTFYRRRESGMNPAEAIQGLEARITGSKDFQDRAYNIRSSLINQSIENRTQDQWEDLLRRTRLTEEASALAADYQKVIKEYGPQIASIWMNQHEEALKKNPYAYEKVMGLVGQDANLLGSTPLTAEVAASKLERNLPNITEGRNKLDRITAEVRSLGINPEDLTKVPTTEDVVSVIDPFAKARNYEGKDYSDFYENVMGLYNIGMDAANELKGQGVYGGEALVMPAIKKFLQTRVAAGLPFFGDSFQDTASASEIRNYIRQLAPRVTPLKDAWRDIEPFRKAIEEHPTLALDVVTMFNQAYAKAQTLPPNQREQYLGNVASDLMKKISTANYALSQTGKVHRDLFGE